MSINKAVAYIFFVIVSAPLFAMELEKSQELSKSQSRQSPSFTEYASSCLSSWSDSVYNTTMNNASNYYAFRKLGWPLTDPIAQDERIKNQNLYKRFNDAIQQGKDYENFLKDCEVIDRRGTTLRSVLGILDNYPDALNFALFCVADHGLLMNSFEMSRFLRFIMKEREKSTQGMQKVYETLTKTMVLPNDNESFNNFVKLNDSEKKEEEKKEESKKGDGKKEQKNNGKK